MRPGNLLQNVTISIAAIVAAVVIIGVVIWVHEAMTSAMTFGGAPAKVFSP